VAASVTSIDAVFMLQAHKIVPIEIEEVGRSFIRSRFFLIEFQAHSFWILIIGIGIIDGNGKQAPLSVFDRKRRAKIRRERRNPALARQIISNECDTRRQRETKRFRPQRPGWDSNSLAGRFLKMMHFRE
jgi:hypothetical protein